MNTASPSDVSTDRYDRCIAASKRVRWDIDSDVIRGRSFDATQKFLPDGLTLLGGAHWLSAEEKRHLSQIQGRTYANMFGLVERFIDAKILEITQHHWLGDQTALEALVRFSDEELKHQELFRRIELLIADGMPAGYSFAWDPNTIGASVLSKSTWAVLGLTLLIELFSQAHYRESIEPDVELSPLFKDVFLFHWKEESQHAILDELEWVRVDSALSEQARDIAVDELIELILAVDGIVQSQANADCSYFKMSCARPLDDAEEAHLQTLLRKAYRSQYILSGARHAGFVKVLSRLTTHAQKERFFATIEKLA
ncbi:hypothetical protein [Paraburkholderia solisilvae]|uniref:Uncharacterized protein n=1 Tax=Paraburkholderia solisilvae TaxID=624376 RepID=A0A6J5DXZ8_9BURK|nr:hypothetical protein [Paraburkholderia solisilvae]CAB3759069.1 hypothetical protein LMG29739_03097 [Paraburkholderia solisilvae]